MATVDDLDQVIERSHLPCADGMRPLGPWSVPLQLQGWRDYRLRERGEVRYLRACLHRGGGALQGQGWQEGGYYPRDFARHEHPQARRWHLEDRAPPCGPHNHSSASRIGDPGVALPPERTSENAASTHSGEQGQEEGPEPNALALTLLCLAFRGCYC